MSKTRDRASVWLRKAVSVLAATTLAFSLLPVGALTAYAAEGDVATKLSVEPLGTIYDKNGKSPYFRVTLTAADGSPLDNYNELTPKVYVGSKSANAGIVRDTTYKDAYINLSSYVSAGTTYDVYASFSANKTYYKTESETRSSDRKNYLASESERFKLTFTAQEAPTVQVVDAVKGSSNGKLLIGGANGRYQYTTTTPTQSNVVWNDIDGATLSGLAKGTYYVRSAPFLDGNATVGYTQYLASNADDSTVYVTATVGESELARHTVTFAAADNARWENADAVTVEHGANATYAKVKADEGYVVKGVRVQPEGAADVTLYPEYDNRVDIENVTGDVTLTPVVALEQVNTIDTSLAITGVEPFKKLDASGAQPQVKITFADEEGQAIADAAGNAVVVHCRQTSGAGDEEFDASEKAKTIVFSSATESDAVIGPLEAGATYEVWATYVSQRAKNDNARQYASAESQHVAISVEAQDAPEVATTPTLQGKGDGTVSVIGEGVFEWVGKGTYSGADKINYDLWNDYDRPLTGLDAATYYVRAATHAVASADNAYTLYLTSPAADAVVGVREPATYTATFEAVEHATWSNADAQTFTEGKLDSKLERSVKAGEGYIVTSIAASPADAATVEFDRETGTVQLSNVTADVTLTPVVEIDPDYQAPLATHVAIEKVEASTVQDKLGRKPAVTVSLKDENGNAIVDAVSTYVRVYYGDSQYQAAYLAESGAAETGVVYTGALKPGDYTLRAVYSGGVDAADSKQRYLASESDAVNLTVVEAPEFSVSAHDASYNGGADGAISVSGNGSFEYAPAGASVTDGEWAAIAGGTASGLAKGDYLVRAASTYDAATGTLVLASEPKEVTVAEAEPRDYTVTFAESEHYTWRWTGGGSFAVAEQTGSRSLGVEASDGYYVESVSAEPASAAAIEFDQATGGITVSHVTENFTLTAHVKRQVAPAKLEVVSWELLPQGSVDALFDANSRATVRFTVKATGESGQPAPEVSIGFSTDNGESAYDLLEFSRATGLDGLATFKVSFPVGGYSATFTTNDADYAQLSTAQPITVATQEAPVLYESAITNVSAPGARDGSYRGLDEGLEYFTYTLKATELDAPYFRYDSTGELGGWWEPVENGEIIGLAPGTYAVRYAQRADQEANTVYLFSDYATFPVRNAYRTVTADAANSSHVTFVEPSQTTGQNGTVYFRVKVDSGYTLSNSGISVDYPGYVGGIAYYPAQNTIQLTGVTRDLKLSARATAVPAATPERTPAATPVASASPAPASATIASPNVAAPAAQVYTGKAVTPALTVTVGGKELSEGVDYTVAYRNNVRAGTAEVTVTGKGNYSGTVKKSFKIAKASVAQAKVSKIATQKLKKKGKAVKPKVTVKYAGKKLKSDKDYTLTYKNNKKKGTAKVTVKGKGLYTGSKTVKFKIK